MNKTFENHEDLDINNGILVAQPKPGKPKGPPQNLRPVTLLNSIRKVLSTIALTRIRHAVENYISCSQSGFRPNRSTSDVVWAHRWISAKVLNYAEIEIDITGIDMSAAFDTIDRKQLLQLLTNLVTEDEKRIIQFLLSNTTLNVKISGANTEEPFLTNIGTPQGDNVLFIGYLEQALKNVRSTLDSPSNTTEIVYADDIDFIGHQPVNVKKIEETLKVHKLKVNVDKTEHTSVRKHSEEWKTSKKVGSLLGSKEDIEHRKHLSNIALNKMEQIWDRADKTKQRTRIRLYNTLMR
ncbi:very-long-chain enoyl-CoA reductase [Elysia marginata]|uniref:Very-long-chain enoyl-CoA reductase n=1 Tax=Elysia marginata TaxID=1093978 RepID=A0AAV4HP34_9GAST|nr:very-long-chain enoyl-CoA reductase [Elysia marginata]